MVDFPTYLRPVDLRVEKKPQVRQNAEEQSFSQGATHAAKHDGQRPADKVLVLFPRAAAMQSVEEAPSRQEAEEALAQLREDLPAAGQLVGQIHEFADRRRIIALLAPLVDC